MKDRVFSGRDAREALATAARALGLPAEGLRYVVLAPGPEPPAQIAILLEAARPARDRDPRRGIGRVVAALAEALGAPLEAEICEAAERVSVRLSGPGCGALLVEGGRPAKALEHLLRSMYGWQLASRPLALEVQGLREARDAWLRERARELAEAVRAEARPHHSEPLNAYDRRILHLALASEAGVRSHSEGEGRNRCVSVTPVSPDPSARPAEGG